jgi:hypothetical protein
MQLLIIRKSYLCKHHVMISLLVFSRSIKMQGTIFSQIWHTVAITIITKDFVSIQWSYNYVQNCLLFVDAIRLGKHGNMLFFIIPEWKVKNGIVFMIYVTYTNFMSIPYFYVHYRRNKKIKTVKTKTKKNKKKRKKEEKNTNKQTHTI